MSLDRALAYAGTHTPDDLHAGIAAGRFQQWGSGDSVIVTEILDTPQKRFLHFFLAEGTLPELRAMVPAILDWGRAQGCTHASLVGRFGWLRTFVKEFGFKKTAVMMEATLEGGPTMKPE